MLQWSGILLKLIFQQNTFVHGILGGYEVNIQEVPYQVNYGDMCGGVLIHHKWALAAAHCGTLENYIRVGSKYRLKGLKIKVLSHILHPNFGHSHTYDYDVQLLRLRPVKYNEDIQNINISSSCSGDVLVAGWGYQKEKGEYNKILMQVKLKIVPMKRCQRINKYIYNYTLTDRMFCAGGFGKDACQGDSGGGAISFGKVIGVSSFGFGCGRNIPGVFVNLSHSDIREWIHGYTGV